MPRNSSVRTTGTEEIVNHYGAIRLRVNGTGNLRPTFYSLDKVLSNVMVPIVMQVTTADEPNRLGNFTQKRAKLRLETTAINEYFLISKIIIFTRPVAMSFPETS